MANPHHISATCRGATRRRLSAPALFLLALLAGPALGIAHEGSIEAPPFLLVDTNFEQAQWLMQRGDFAAAVPLLEKVVRSDDRNADAYNMLGISLRMLKRYEEALRSDQQALAIESHHRGAHASMGETYLALDQPARAKAQLEFLDGACWFGCAEFDALKAAIEQHEGQGGA